MYCALKGERLSAARAGETPSTRCARLRWCVLPCAERPCARGAARVSPHGASTLEWRHAAQPWAVAPAQPVPAGSRRAAFSSATQSSALQLARARHAAHACTDRPGQPAGHGLCGRAPPRAPYVRALASAACHHTNAVQSSALQLARARHAAHACTDRRGQSAGHGLCGRALAARALRTRTGCPLSIARRPLTLVLPQVAHAG